MDGALRSPSTRSGPHDERSPSISSAPAARRAGVGAALIAAAIMAPRRVGPERLHAERVRRRGHPRPRCLVPEHRPHLLVGTARSSRPAAPPAAAARRPRTCSGTSTGSGNGRAALGERNALVNPTGDRDASGALRRHRRAADAGAGQPDGAGRRRRQRRRRHRGRQRQAARDPGRDRRDHRDRQPAQGGAGDCTVGTEVFDPAPAATTRPARRSRTRCSRRRSRARSPRGAS